MTAMVIKYGGAFSTDISAAPNTGVRTTVDVTDISGLIPAGGNAYIAVWVAVEFPNLRWAQFGYFTNGPGTGMNWFYQIWEDPGESNESELGGNSGSLPSLGSHQFAIYLQAGTVWAFALDGLVLGTFDMNANVSAGTGAPEPIEAVVEQQQLNGIPSYIVPIITFTAAIETRQNGVWGAVLVGNAVNINADFGTRGRDQVPSLGFNQVVVGDGIPKIPNGTELWHGPSQATITGSLGAQATAGEVVTLKVTLPDTSQSTFTALTSASGGFTALYQGPQKGTYSVVAMVTKDSRYGAAISAPWIFTLS